jgi:hypothetical protein
VTSLSHHDHKMNPNHSPPMAQANTGRPPTCCASCLLSGCVAAAQTISATLGLPTSVDTHWDSREAPSFASPRCCEL